MRWGRRVRYESNWANLSGREAKERVWTPIPAEAREWRFEGGEVYGAKRRRGSEIWHMTGMMIDKAKPRTRGWQPRG